MHIALVHYSGLRWATFNPCQPNIDVRGDPTFFRGLRTAFIERNSICETWQIGKRTLLLLCPNDHREAHCDRFEGVE
jgi:hypothetical protein